MRGKIIVPKHVEKEVPQKRTAKMRRCERSNREQQELCAGCGVRLRTRRGETRCPVHGTMWSWNYWDSSHWSG